MKIKNYIILNQTKYIVLILSTFLLIIWLAQIIKFLDFGNSVSIQLYKVIEITSYLIPNLINTILPIIIFISSCFYNRHLNSTNEITIISLYLSPRDIFKYSTLLYLAFISFYIANGEIMSVESYNKFKVKEIEFRNNFKIQSINNNQITIPEKINLFYESKNKEDGSLQNVITFIIEEELVIKSTEVQINRNNQQINFTFLDGNRIVAKRDEKSFTKFDKIEYTIKQNKVHKISLGKENFNTINLLRSKDDGFIKSAHRKIIDLLFFIIILISSVKIIFLNQKEVNTIFNYLILLIIILSTFIIISLLSNVYNNNIISSISYFLLNITVITMSHFGLNKKYAYT